MQYTDSCTFVKLFCLDSSVAAEAAGDGVRTSDFDKMQYTWNCAIVKWKDFWQARLRRKRRGAAVGLSTFDAFNYMDNYSKVNTIFYIARNSIVKK
jgi:hypothetical protein